MSLSSDQTAIVGLDTPFPSGRVGSDDKWDPLGSTLNVPLHGLQNSKDDSLPPLRIVVISDTHGFEGALAKFADPTSEENLSPDESLFQKILQGDEFLLPPADVLLHCGDFAASGSRKTQRTAARRLDD